MRKAAETITLTNGPTAAIRSSAPGFGASPARRATPPNSHNVMPSTATPLRRATIACESSWASRDRKKIVPAVRPPMA